MWPFWGPFGLWARGPSGPSFSPSLSALALRARAEGPKTGQKGPQKGPILALFGASLALPAGFGPFDPPQAVFLGPSARRAKIGAPKGAPIWPFSGPVWALLGPFSGPSVARPGPLIFPLCFCSGPPGPGPKARDPPQKGPKGALLGGSLGPFGLGAPGPEGPYVCAVRVWGPFWASGPEGSPKEAKSGPEGAPICYNAQ